MWRLYRKIFRIPRTVEAVDSNSDLQVIGSKLESKVKDLFRGSLAIREVDAGSDNSFEQELTALANPYYDVERFGIHFVASPRHADMLMVTGPVSRNMATALKKAYEATPDPKIVVAVGDPAINGGIFKGSYAILDGVHKVIPVDFQIPGDPPSPKIVLQYLLQILEIIEQKKPQKEIQ